MTGSLAQPPDRFRQIARAKLADAHAQTVLDRATTRHYDRRVAAWKTIPNIEDLRERAHEIRMRTIDDLDRYLGQFTQALERRGGRVHFAHSSDEAVATVVEICRGHGARLVAKGKSMVSEEIRLNDALAAAGIDAIETDLGEFVLQLAGEQPVHIIAPALEKTASDVAELFSTLEGHPVSAELGELVSVARRRLRDVFHTADVGITGANFGVAETGSIVLVTNEGNGRMVSALPRVHIALMGMERLVPTTSDLAVLLPLLTRSATAQRLTTYTTILTGPRRNGETDGPEEMHVVVLDNGRSSLRRGRYREMLACIRCGSCLNVCPVYRKTGGAAYGPVYSGPMGAVLVPLLVGLENAPSLPHASSLCGACTAACPVNIPLHELLLDLRRDLVADRVAPVSERVAFTLWSLLWATATGYRLSTVVARAVQPLVARLGPGKAWSRGRQPARLARPRYRDRYEIHR
jgi:L-lactate dehydrogenase complex protein LldF